MPDFSFGKLIVLGVIIAVVWYGWKYVQRVEAVRRALKAEIERRRAGAPSAQNRPTENLVKCAVCGTYVPSRGARACSRADCPWPR